MPEVILQFQEPHNGAFILLENNEKQGEMLFEISPASGATAHKAAQLIIRHTEVKPENEGKGFAKLMFLKMIAYARENHLQVVPFCTYVLSQLKRNPEQYQDVWTI